VKGASNVVLRKGDIVLVRHTVRHGDALQPASPAENDSVWIEGQFGTAVSIPRSSIESVRSLIEPGDRVIYDDTVSPGSPGKVLAVAEGFAWTKWEGLDNPVSVRLDLLRRWEPPAKPPADPLPIDPLPLEPEPPAAPLPESQAGEPEIQF
jgi:hypothetical protein